MKFWTTGNVVSSLFPVFSTFVILSDILLQLKLSVLVVALRKDANKSTLSLGETQSRFLLLSKSEYCRFNKSTRQLYCNGSLDHQFFRRIRNQPIEDLIVDNYMGDSANFSPSKGVQSLQSDALEKCYFLIFDGSQKITGQLHWKNTGLCINFILKMVPTKNRDYEYHLEGEAFSTKFVKISVNLKGNLTLSRVKNNFVVSIIIETTDLINNEWIIKSNLTLINGAKSEVFDEGWIAGGTVISNHTGENTIRFSGLVETKVVRKECTFSGEINLQSGNLLWNIGGKVSMAHNDKVTIPRAVFSNMSVKNIIFRNSHFLNDFDKNAFEGLKGVETVSFLSSRLEVMPKLNELFWNMESLRELYIEDCTTPQLKFGYESWQGLKNLQKISFKETGPLEFHQFSFMWLGHSNVTYLNLQNSYIVLPQTERAVLGRISHTLKYLDVSYSNLKSENDLTVILKDLKLEWFAAEGLKLKKIPTVALSAVKSTLRYLSLKGSNLEKTFGKNIFNAIFDFPLMANLRELDLSDSQINCLERGAFDRLPNLQVLNLANNNLENIQDGWLLMWPRITHLDLSLNGRTFQQTSYVGQGVDTSINLFKFDKLQVLNLTSGIFSNTTKIIKSLGKSLRKLFLGNTDLKNLNVDVFDKMIYLEELDLSMNGNLNSDRTFSMNLFRNLKNLKTLSLKGCRINTASMYWFAGDNETDETGQGIERTPFETLQSMQILDLSSNNIKKIDSVMFRVFPNLKVLKLSGNGVTTWESGTFDFSEHLEAVYLNENKIEVITTAMKADLLKLPFFKLGNNPFICGPYVYDLINMTKTPKVVSGYPHDFPNLKLFDNYTEKIPILDWAETNYVCFSTSRGKFVPFTSVEEDFYEHDVDENLITEMNRNAYLWVVVAVIFGTVLTIGIFCWKVLDIHLITKVIRNAVALSFLSHGNKEPEKYDYNVFVSYSDKDRQWVIDELMPGLQSINDIKVCLHERDFQVGLSILENIIASIDNSRNIVLVLSTAFLKSHWCQYEMHLAQHRLLEKGREQLILIFLEEIPPIKRPRSLRYLMMTKTYLEWPVKPKNRSEFDLFWTRLFKALKL